VRSPVPIVDCHGHIGVHPDFPAYKASVEEMLQVMDLLDIERLAITSTLACYNDCPRGNAEVGRVLERYPDRFLGYVTVNPNPIGQALEQLEKHSHFHQPPLIKMHPFSHHYPVNGPNYTPAWDAIVLVHTWDSDSQCGPLLLGPIAQKFPHARILLGHAGVTWRGYEQSLAVAARYPNVFLDIAGSQSHRTIIEHCVARIGAERVLFGSDLPFLEAAISLGRVLTARISHLEKESILRSNFDRLIRGNTLREIT
jgi:uncharacterized protein